MKTRPSLALFSSVALIAATPLAFAKGGHGMRTKSAAAECEIAICDKPAIEILIAEEDDSSSEPVEDGGVSDSSDTGAAGEDPVIVDDSGSDGEVTADGDTPDEENVTDGGDSETDTEVDLSDSDDGEADGEVTGVPIDWVKRGGETEDPDIILYNMAGGSPIVSKGETSAFSKVTGQNEKGADIATEGAAVSQIKREKKAPVALIKKGRVFLR